MTTRADRQCCPVCGFDRVADSCAVCAGHASTLGRRGAVVIGTGSPPTDVIQGILDVRRAVAALLFERDFVGSLRLPVAANMIATLVVGLTGWLWLLPAFESRFDDPGDAGAHLWLVALWLGAGPAVIDLLAGWAMDPIRRATEQHMLGATPNETPRAGPSLSDRLQLLALSLFTGVLMMGLVLLPWVGVPLCVLLGAAVAGVVYMQPPFAVRGVAIAARIRRLRAQPWRALGAGLGLQAAAAVPFLNLLALLPVATVVATSTYIFTVKEPRVTAPGEATKHP